MKYGKPHPDAPADTTELADKVHTCLQIRGGVSDGTDADIVICYFGRFRLPTSAIHLESPEQTRVFFSQRAYFVLNAICCNLSQEERIITSRKMVDLRLLYGDHDLPPPVVAGHRALQFRHLQTT